MPLLLYLLSMHGTRSLPTAVLAWVLLIPPDGGPPGFGYRGTGCNDPGHLNECAPLAYWRNRGSFADEAACKAARGDHIAAAKDDVEWADWQLARCFVAERVTNGPGLLPGE